MTSPTQNDFLKLVDANYLAKFDDPMTFRLRVREESVFCTPPNRAIIGDGDTASFGFMNGD